MPKQITYEKPKSKSRIGGRLEAKTAKNKYENWSNWPKKYQPLANAGKNMSQTKYINEKQKRLVGQTASNNSKHAYANKVNSTISNNDITRYRNTVRTGLVGAAKSIKDNTNTAKGFATKAKKIINIGSNNTAKSGATSDPYKAYYDLWNKNNAINVAMNRENNAFNAEQAAAQRGFEEMMSNTAHQREVADLKAAGLNPILSAGGMGASTPSGAAASANNFNGADTSLMGALAELAASSISANATMTAAQTHANAQKEAAMISGQYGYLSAGQAAEATQYAAQVAAGASMYGADQSRAAAMYGADKSYLGTRYGADKGYAGTVYGSDKSYKGQLYSAGIYTAGNLLGDILGFAFPTKHLNMLSKL